MSHVAGVIDYANLEADQWHASGIDLSPWANEPFITFDFAVQAEAYKDLYIDRLSSATRRPTTSMLRSRLPRQCSRVARPR